MSADGGLRLTLTKGLPLPDWYWTPVETGGTISGVPDSHWLHQTSGDHGWLECKKTDGWAVEVRPHQVGWIKIHHAAGVNCKIAVRSRGQGSSGGSGDGLWVVRGGGIAELAERGLRLSGQHVVGVWRGPPDSWNWAEISRAIRSNL